MKFGKPTIYSNGRSSVPTKAEYVITTSSTTTTNGARIKDLRECTLQTTLDKISRSNGDTMNDDFSITNEEEN